MSSNFVKVKEFHTKYGAPVRTYAQNISDEELALRVKLIDEEYNELTNELTWLSDSKQSLCRVAKEMVDLLYVVYGTAAVLGIDIDAVFDEVHVSNMTKTPGVNRPDGKILKGPDYREPNVEKVIEFSQNVV